jgi:hypothetical protein
VLKASRRTVVALILAATVLFVVGIVLEKNTGEHHSDSIAQAAETAAEHAAESGGSAEATTTKSPPAKRQKSAEGTVGGAPSETQVEHAGESAGENHGETGGEAHGESGNDERVLGINYESTPLVILAVLASLGLAAVVWIARSSWFLLLVAAVMLAFAVFDVAEVFHQVDRDEAGIAVLAGFVAALHLGAGLGSARLRREPAAS